MAAAEHGPSEAVGSAALRRELEAKGYYLKPEEEVGDLKELKDGLKRANIGNSGTIDYGEFVAATLHMNKLEREGTLVSTFSFFSKDGSGFLIIDQLSQACNEFSFDDAHLEYMMKDVDQNNDGQIDYNEFTVMM